MFNSTILDVAIGLIFTFLAVSLVASAAVEAISSALKWRSGFLLEGVQQLVNDPDFAGLALELYMHAAVNPRGIPAKAAANSGTSPQWTDWLTFKARALRQGTIVDYASRPAYIKADQFASALMDILKLSDADTNPAVSMQAALDASSKPTESPAPKEGDPQIKKDAQTGKDPKTDKVALIDPQIHQLLSGIVQRCRGDAAKVEAQIAAWYDVGMDRLSGAYKRRTQLVSFLVALVLAVVINADAIQVAHVLWAQPTLADDLKLPEVVQTALSHDAPHASGISPETQAAEAALTVVDEHLPLGWQGEKSWPTTNWGWFFKILGWVLTAGATLFGAPFWFDTLQAFVRLKGTGPSPQDRSKGRAAA